MDELSAILPNLKQLCLDGSRLPSVRELGHGFSGLTTLSACACEMLDLCGLGDYFLQLQELYVSDNLIEDLEPLGYLPALQTVHLQKYERVLGVNVSQRDTESTCCLHQRE